MSYGAILDASIVVLVTLFVIFGTWRGMFKLIFGFVSSVAAIALAAALAGPVTDALPKNAHEKLRGAIEAKIPAMVFDQLDARNVHAVLIDEEGEETIEISHSSGETYASIAEYLKLKKPTFAAVGGFLDKALKAKNIRETLFFGDESRSTLDCVIVAAATRTALVVVAFVALWLVAYVAVRLLMMLVRKAVRTTYVGNFLDRALGFLIGAALGMVIVWGALALVRHLYTYAFIIPVNDVVNSSAIGKFLYDNNIIYKLIGKLMR